MNKTTLFEFLVNSLGIHFNVVDFSIVGELNIKLARPPLRTKTSTRYFDKQKIIKKACSIHCIASSSALFMEVYRNTLITFMSDY